MTLREMERQAVLLEQPEHPLDYLDDIMELERRQRWQQKPRMADLLRSEEALNAGGQFYQDTRPPFNTAAYPSVTLSTTSKMSLPANPNAVMNPTDWYPGKKVMVRAFGQFTSAATPGNLTVEIRWATADAGGTILGTSAALTWIASQTNMTWRAEFRVECWSTGNGGASGSLVATGVFECNPAAIAVGQAMIPASAPAGVTVDLQSASGISLQFKRSGSTAETLQVISHEFQHLN